MRGAFKIFFRSEGARPWAVLFSLTLASAFEMVGLGALVPLFALTGGGVEGGEDPWLGRLAIGALDSLGVAIEPIPLICLAILALSSKYVMTFFALNYVAFAEAEVSTRIRARLLEHLFAARWNYLVGRKVGEFANELNNNAMRAGKVYMESARLFSYTIQSVFYLCAAFLISLELTVLGIVVGVAFYILFGRLVAKSREVGQQQTVHMATMSTLVSDTLNNMKPIRAMERQDQILSAIQAQNGKIRAAARRLAVLANAVRTGADSFLVAVLGAGLLIATVWWQIQFASVAVLAIIALRGVDTVRQAQHFLMSVAADESAYWSALQSVQSLASMREQRPGNASPTLEGSCRFEHVSFKYGTSPVIQDVTLTIPSNEITVLIGPSGAGKTSIVDLLLGLHTPDSGTIWLDDTPLDQVDLRQWRRMIGYVPQETTLLHGTIRQNITLGDPSVSDEAVRRALTMAGAETFVEKLEDGLETIAGELGARFSGGERQRIALARALVFQPKLLILDEVTSALDPKTEAEICANIDALKGALTIVAVTHREAWTSIAGRIYKVAGGRAEKVAAWKPDGETPGRGPSEQALHETP